MRIGKGTENDSDNYFSAVLCTWCKEIEKGIENEINGEKERGRGWVEREGNGGWTRDRDGSFSFIHRSWKKKF